MHGMLTFKLCLPALLMLGAALHQSVLDSGMERVAAPARSSLIRRPQELNQEQVPVEETEEASILQAPPPRSSLIAANVRQSQELHQEQVQIEETEEAPILQAGRDRPISFVTIYDPFFETNMAASRLWRDRESDPHEWILLNGTTDGFSLSKAYAEGQARAKNDLLVFAHPDVLLPDDFYPNMMAKLADIERKDPKWGVLGTAGIDINDGHIYGCIKDGVSTQMTGIDGLEVQAVDEHLMVLKKNRSPDFDPGMPGLDMVGQDIVLAARRLGLKSYLLNVPVLHKTVDVDGTPFTREKFLEKLGHATYHARLETTAKYFQSKWCKSGYLPNQGSTWRVTCTQVFSPSGESVLEA